MEKGMNTNKYLIIGSIVVVLFIIGIPTTYKVIKNHQNNLIKVVTDKIIIAAKKCHYDEKCSNDKITLKELYDNKYLDKLSNPITKEYYNELSYVKISNNNYEFFEE
jgi:hypothetical protein